MNTNNNNNNYYALLTFLGAGVWEVVRTVVAPPPLTTATEHVARCRVSGLTCMFVYRPDGLSVCLCSSVSVCG